ncbi:MAG: PAS domain S-box protein [Fervidobacterium sp.]
MVLDERILKHFLEASDSVFLVLDPEGKILYINENGTRLLEFNGNELLGENWFRKCVSPNEYDVNVYVFKAVLSGKAHKFDSFESNIVTRTGKKRLITWRYRDIEGERGLAHLVLMIGKDVTSHSILINNLLLEEMRLKKLIESVTDYVFIIDVFPEQGKMVYHSHSQGCYNVTGYSEKEFGQDGFLWNRIIHPDDRYQVEKQKELMLQGHQVGVFEHRIIHKTGAIKWVSNCINYFHQIDDGYRYDVMISDITQRKHAEEKLRRSEAKLQIFTEATLEAIILLENFVIVDMNEQALRMFCAVREDMMNQDFMIFVAEESKEALRKIPEGFFEIIAIRKDRSLFPCEVTIRRLESLTGENRILVLRDISEKKEAERKLLNTIIEVEEKERRKFSRELHDGLGPVLSSVKLYLDLFNETKDEEKRTAIYGKTLECLNEAIRSLKEISSNLSPSVLRHGVIYAIRAFVERVSVDQSKVPEIVFRYNLEKRYDKNIEVSLYRIVTELINNTIKHAKATRINIYLFHDVLRKNLVLSYSDNGLGMDIDKEMRELKGSGLTNICQRVDFLKGSISFESRINEGLSIKVVVPVNE